MTSTLLFRLEGPLQSWGTSSRFSHRDTGKEPSKSGVVGLICAALGKPRDEQPDDGFPRLVDLASLQMGVRVDREGRVSKDYHTAQCILKAGAKKPESPRKSDIKETEVSTRYYLADASFIVGMEGNRELLERVAVALRSPHWPVFLGRKAFVPSCPLLPAAFANDGSAWPDIVNSPLREALLEAPYSVPVRFALDSVRVILDDSEGVDVSQDVPVSFELGLKRAYSARRTRTEFWNIRSDLPNIVTCKEAS